MGCGLWDVGLLIVGVFRPQVDFLSKVSDKLQTKKEKKKNQRWHCEEGGINF